MCHVPVVCCGRIVYIYFVKTRNYHAGQRLMQGSQYNSHDVIHCTFVPMLLFSHDSLREESLMRSAVRALRHVITLRAGLSLHTQAPRLQLCPRQVFLCKLRNQDCNFNRDKQVRQLPVDFPHPTLSLASEQTLNYLKRSTGAPTWR